MKQRQRTRLLAGVLCVLVGCTGDGRNPSDSVKVQAMQNVVEFSLASVSDIADTYYGSNPSQLVPAIVDHLTAANAPPTDAELAGISEEEKQAAKNVWVPSFAALRPTKPGQIVISADADRGMIILEAYGVDLSHPITTRERLVAVAH